LKEAVGPLRDLASRAAESAEAGAVGLAAMREETRSLPGTVRSAREELEEAVDKGAQEQTQLLREIGGKVLEEISLVLAEMRRSASQGPEAFAGFAQEIAGVRAAQKETAKTLTRLGDLLEQNPQAELTLSAIQQIQERNEASGAGLAMLLDMVRRGDQALRQMQESHDRVIQAFQSHRQAAQEEEDRIRQRLAQENNNRGVVLYYRGALEPAEASFRKAIEADSRYAEAWNNLGLVLSRLGKAEDATAAFEKAIEIDPGMGEVYNNLGFLYHTSLQYDRALEMFNQALQTTSDSAVAYTNLGNTYYKLSRHEQAVQAWKRALELDPLNENARRCLRMYQQESA
jgi:tetratricopeptide (TPR) repeat protein